MNMRIEKVVAQAAGEGLLPQQVAVPAGSGRPWPVVVLTALGAWLAAIPLLFMFALLLGDIFQDSFGAYLVGLMALAGGLALLRTDDLPLFLEQVAVVGLVVGGGSLAFALFRDLPERLAAGMMLAVAIGAAVLLAQHWLRLLLGAAAAGFAQVAFMPPYALAEWLDPQQVALLSVYAALAIWVAALRWQRRQGDAQPAKAAALESIAAGWLLSLLVTLAMLSGSTFLLGAHFGGNLLAEIGSRGWMSLGWGLIWLEPALSVALTLAAAELARRAWPVLRQPAYLVAVLVLAVLAWFLPGLGAAFLALALTGVTQRFLLAAAAAGCVVWMTGSFYYYLGWPLATKAMVLVAAGAVLGAAAWFAHFSRARAAMPAQSAQQEDAHARPAAPGRSGAWIALAAAATLVLVNYAIWQKETLIANGQPVFIDLAPVDPRSLMQGDFMRLDFRLPARMWIGQDGGTRGERPYVVAQRDARGVAQLLRVHEPGASLAAGEFLIELTPKNGRWILVTDAWFFREGDAARWEAARFGEFRVDAKGRALLVGMADENLKRIEP